MVLIILRETKGEKFMHLHYTHKRDYISPREEENCVSAHNSFTSRLSQCLHPFFHYNYFL